MSLLDLTFLHSLLKKQTIDAATEKLGQISFHATCQQQNISSTFI